MQTSQYVFLRRNMEIDLPRLSRAIQYYADMGQPYQVTFVILFTIDFYFFRF